MSRAPASVRAAGPTDAGALWGLIRELARYERLEERLAGSAEALRAHLAATPAAIHALLAERAGRAVGYAIYFPTYSTFRTRPMMWLEDLYVEPGERGTGTGRALFEAVARAAAARGAWRLSWEVLEWNEPAIGFYERLGARRDGGGWFIYHLPEAALARAATGGGAGPAAGP